MSIYHVLMLLSLVGLIIFTYLFDKSKPKTLSVQKFLRKTSRIWPNWRAGIMPEKDQKSRIILACISLESNGVERMVFMREKDLYPPSRY